jgi:hypothetical protein
MYVNGKRWYIKADRTVGKVNIGVALAGKISF